MALPSYFSSLTNREPDALTKLEGVQAHGTPLLVSANRSEGNITQANRTSQTKIDLLIQFFAQNDEVQRDMMARAIENAHKITTNSDISRTSLSETSSSNTNSSAPVLAPEDRETLERARQAKLTEMVEMKRSISAGFSGLLDKCCDANVDFDYMPDVFEAIEEDIAEHKFRFELTSESLIKAVESSPLEETKLSVLFHTEVFGKMERISQALEVTPGFLETIFNNFRDKDNPGLDEQARRRAMQPKSEAKDVLANIGRCLDQFDELAQPLIGERANTQKDHSHMFSLQVEEFKRLSCESIATATLFQCFCKACPRHQRHTAYLSLESSNSAAPGTRMAILSSGPKEKDPVWLRVVSTPQMSSRKGSNDMECVPGTGKHKRRRSSDGLAPPSKLRKTVTASPRAPEHDGLVKIDKPPQNPIQVCPEYLAQHEEAELLVMQMVDASSAFHKFYFLPADERPPANCEPLSLHKMLLQHHRRILPVGDRQILWKVQVARLISEAALQFDWPETRCHWGREDIIFYTRQPSSDILGPFLKVEIERRSHTTSTTSGEQPPSSGGQTRRLLNLAFTLLQVGLFKPIEPPPEDWNDSMYRDYIDGISRGEAHITGYYNAVVRQCTELAAAAGGADIDREDFRKRYYQYIISPLKGMETNLLGLQRKD